MNKENHFLNISFSGTREQIQKAIYDKEITTKLIGFFLDNSKSSIATGVTEYDCAYEAELFPNTQVMFLNDLVRERIETYLLENTLEEIVTDRQNALDSSDKPC